MLYPTDGRRLGSAGRPDIPPSRAPVDTGCVLRLSHHVPDASKAIESCFVVGLHTSLARLAPCLDGHPVAWDWDAVAEAQAQYASAGLAPAPGP
jgi:hypothetical protein